MNVPTDIMRGLEGIPRTNPLYYEDPYMKEFEAEVLKATSSGDLSYVVLDKTCFFPEGGGQPGDLGQLVFPDGRMRVVDTQAVDDVIVHIAERRDDVNEVDPVKGVIDWDVRYERMKQHTGSHLIFSAAKRALSLRELMYKGVQIGEKTSRIDISYGKSISHGTLREIERLSNAVCLENRKVRSWFTTREEAERTYGGQLGLTDVTPSGNVRVVDVGDWDVALCSGTHVRSTAEIGLISILDRFRLKKGVERIEFTAGRNSYELHNKQMKTLAEAARLFQTSSNEVLPRIRRLLKERDGLKKELGGARERLVEFEALQLLKGAKALGDMKILRHRLPEVNAQSLKRIASRLAGREPHLVAILGSQKGNSAFLVGAAGEKAVERGIDMAAMIRKGAQLIRGGGGGSPGLAQAGGQDPGGLEEALTLIENEVSERLREG